MPYSVKQLLEDNPPPISIAQSNTVADALRLMAEHDYSQLPVVDAGNKPIGLVTPESIIRGLRNFNLAIDQLKVREVMAAPSKFSQDDDLFDLLQQLQSSSAVLITDAASKLVGIVTSYDATDYFRQRAENVMLVEDIEVMIRDFIPAAYQDEFGQLDKEKLNHAAAKNKTFEELSLYQYITLLLSEQTWSFFEPIFQIPKENLDELLQNVRKTRNQLAHFRDEISTQQADQLRYCSDWLGRCWEDYQASIAPEPTLVKPSQSMIPTDDGVSESTTNQWHVANEETAPTDSRYAPLANFLLSMPAAEDQIALTFSDVQEIIGGDLPASARKHQAWWANDTSDNGKPSALWLEAGWRRNRLNMTAETVSFKRIAGREKAYIEFFSTLRAQLTEKTSFSLLNLSPNGRNWDTWQSLHADGKARGWFSFSFNHGKRFRIELYLGPTSEEGNEVEELFDFLYARKAEIENNIVPLSWERLDGKKASRIALYHTGSITDEADTLDALQEWAVKNSIIFYNAIEPIGKEAINQLLGAD